MTANEYLLRNAPQSNLSLLDKSIINRMCLVPPKSIAPFTVFYRDRVLCELELPALHKLLCVYRPKASSKL